MNEKTLDELFNEAFENANLIPKESVPTDLQLVLYGYYKKAISENLNYSKAVNEPNDLKNAFKLNAWMQVQHITINEAKEKYIEIINQLLKDKH